jgi:hypothetical protein
MPSFPAAISSTTIRDVALWVGWHVTLSDKVKKGIFSDKKTVIKDCTLRGSTPRRPAGPKARHCDCHRSGHYLMSSSMMAKFKCVRPQT